MKKILFSILLMFSVQTFGGGFYVSGNKLYEWLMNPPSRMDAYRYIQGIADAEEATKSELLWGIGVNRIRFCAPDDATVKQTSDIVEDYLRANAPRRHMPAADLARDALIQAWPCPK